MRCLLVWLLFLISQQAFASACQDAIATNRQPSFCTYECTAVAGGELLTLKAFNGAAGWSPNACNNQALPIMYFFPFPVQAFMQGDDLIYFWQVCMVVVFGLGGICALLLLSLLRR